MNKILTIIAVIILVIAAFFFLRKPVAAPATENVETPSETVTPAPQTPTQPSPKPTGTPAPSTTEYSYTNNEFKFAVKLPGLVATRKSNTPAYVSAIFTFGVGDQSQIEEQKRVPNTMAVYIWNDPADFEAMKNTGEDLGTETIRGTTYHVYSFSNEDTTTYRYTTTVGELIYDVGVRNRADAQKFFFID